MGRKEELGGSISFPPPWETSISRSLYSQHQEWGQIPQLLRTDGPLDDSSHSFRLSDGENGLGNGSRNLGGHVEGGEE